MAGLSAAVEDIYPATRRIVGDEFFAEVARAYVRADPPRSPVMLEWGGTFADFIAGFAQLDELPYLPHVARLEWAWVEAYHAADASAVDLDHFSRVPQDALPDVRLTMHPSMRVICSPLEILELWHRNVVDAPFEPMTLDDIREDILVARPGVDVTVRRLPPGGAAFAQSLAGGLSVLQAAETAMADDGNFDLGGNLAGLIEAQVVVGCTWQSRDDIQQRGEQ